MTIELGFHYVRTNACNLDWTPHDHQRVSVGVELCRYEVEGDTLWHHQICQCLLLRLCHHDRLNVPEHRTMFCLTWLLSQTFSLLQPIFRRNHTAIICPRQSSLLVQQPFVRFLPPVRCRLRSTSRRWLRRRSGARRHHGSPRTHPATTDRIDC